MAPKTYKTHTIQEAISKIKKEMGPDAVILSTRRIGKNSRNPYERGFFEVTAESVNSAEQPGPASFSVITSDIAEDPFSMAGAGAASVKVSPHHGTIRETLVEIQDTLLMMQQSRGLPDIFKKYPDALKLYAALTKTGMSDQRAEYFIRQACSSRGLDSQVNGDLHKNIIAAITRAIDVYNPFAEKPAVKNQPERCLAAFVGPTGVGKTTTIAKLAADLSLKHKKRVGLLSVDSYRIGAIEQLKTYAAIIGVPCMAAFNRQDVLAAADKMRHRDIILIDTAGQSHLDEKRLRELARLLGQDPCIRTHLVMSVTTRGSDMKSAVERFAALKPQTYVFTKTDETKQRGGIIDQLLDYPMPVSFVTNGQNVPEDILPATRRSMTRLIFNQI